MLMTKLYLVLGMIILGYFPLENLDFKIELNSKKNTLLVTKIKKNKVAEQKNQQAGKEIYADFCIQCHGANGKGDGVKIPPLAKSDWLTKKRKSSIHAIKFGQNGEIVVNKIKYNNVMPAMGLSNKEVADVMNYIMTSWGNKQKVKITEKEVEGVLK